MGGHPPAPRQGSATAPVGSGPPGPPILGGVVGGTGGSGDTPRAPWRGSAPASPGNHGRPPGERPCYRGNGRASRLGRLVWAEAGDGVVDVARVDELVSVDGLLDVALAEI